MRASWAFGLPCPWAPLQSVTTAASRRIRARVARRASLRGKATFFALCECCVSGLGSRARGPVCRGFVVGRASFTRPRAEARGRVLLRGHGRDRSSARGDEGPCWRLTAEAVCVREGPAGLGRRAVPPRWNVSRPWSRGMPPTAGPPRWHGGTRHAARIRRRLPWSLFPFGV
jgi:hypothetical protein